MLLQAQQKYSVDLRRSFVIGDRCIDIAPGKAVGAGTVMVSTGYGAEEILNCRKQSDFFARDLLDGVQYIKQTILSQERSFTRSSHSMKLYPKSSAVILFFLVSMCGCSQSPTSVGSKLIPASSKYTVHDTSIASISDTTFKFSQINGTGSSFLVGNSSSVDAKTLLLFL